MIDPHPLAPHCFSWQRRTTAIYICTVTVTTVGYGDVTPKSNAGRALAGILCFISVLFMAMPISLLGNVPWRRQEKGGFMLVKPGFQVTWHWNYLELFGGQLAKSVVPSTSFN